jgi:hypothetical protein
VIDGSTGKGIGGLTLTVERVPSETFSDRLLCTSKEDGTFSIGGLRTGRYGISGIDRPRTVYTESGRSTDEVEIVIEYVDVVEGRVTGPDGRPVAKGEVQLRAAREKTGGRRLHRNAKTNDDGYYRCLRVDLPFRAGFLRYEDLPSDEGDRHQYLRQKRVFEGSQTIDFRFDEFPVGTAGLNGQVVDQNGSPVEDFRVDIRNKVDWKDYSKDLHQYGYKLSPKTADGRFKVSNLPAGLYRLSVSFGGRRDYEYYSSEVTLEDSKITDFTAEVVKKEAGEKPVAKKTTYYGRVLFEDGTPAIPYSPPWPGARVTVLRRVLVDNEGYFAARLTDEELEQIKAGKIRMDIGYPSYEDRMLTHRIGMFPVEWLSPDKSKAGVFTIYMPKARRPAPTYLARLVGRALPKFEGIKIDFSPDQAEGNAILICFWDMNQRPSRHMIRQLANRAKELKEKGVSVVAVQASKVDRSKLDAWVEKYNVAFPVGMIEGDEEQIDGPQPHRHRRRFWA